MTKEMTFKSAFGHITKEEWDKIILWSQPLKIPYDEIKKIVNDNTENV